MKLFRVVFDEYEFSNPDGAYERTGVLNQVEHLVVAKDISWVLGHFASEIHNDLCFELIKIEELTDCVTILNCEEKDNE